LCYSKAQYILLKFLARYTTKTVILAVERSQKPNPIPNIFVTRSR